MKKTFAYALLVLTALKKENRKNPYFPKRLPMKSI